MSISFPRGCHALINLIVSYQIIERKYRIYCMICDGMSVHVVVEANSPESTDKLNMASTLLLTLLIVNNAFLLAKGLCRGKISHCCSANQHLFLTQHNRISVS